VVCRLEFGALRLGDPVAARTGWKSGRIRLPGFTGMIWLKIIARKRMCDIDQVQAAIAECDEIVAIFVRSTKTADENSR
jgi:hypothetical protein